MNIRLLVPRSALLFGVLPVALAFGQDDAAAPEDPAHDEIRALRDGALEAFEQHDIDRLLTYLHPNVVVTYQNAEVSRGHQGVREFHARMSEGEDREVQNLESKFTVDELSILYGGDTAIAFGSMNDDFELSNGMKFALDSRWTATLVKEDGGWLVAAFHVSTNMFDNGVQRLLLKWNTVKSGVTGGFIGLLVGGLAMIALGKRRKKPQQGAPPHAA